MYPLSDVLNTIVISSEVLSWQQLLRMEAIDNTDSA